MTQNLLERVYDCIGPEIKIDHSQKTYEIVREGIFLNQLTEAYFTFKRYSRINKVLNIDCE